MELRFAAANDKLRRLPFENKELERGHPRWKMYGLSKQVTEGDCKVDCPPAENFILTSKWQAWQAMRGKSREQAISEFLTEYDRFEASGGASAPASSLASPHNPRGSLLPSANIGFGSGSATTASAITPKRGSTVANAQGIIKEGTLYKQRDVFKGWRPRRFVLQEGFLHYYLEADDVSPRRSMDIAGCKVAAEKSGKIGDNDLELFPFVISHVKASKVYTLAADSKEEADDWIAKIGAAAQAAAERPSVAASGGAGGPSPLSLVDSSGDPNARYRPHAPETALGQVPSKYQPKLERAVTALVEAVDPTAPNWESMFERQGVIAKKRAGDVVCVRGDGNVPFALPDVLGTLVNPDSLVDVDTQLQSARLIRSFGPCSGVQHLKYKAVWPANPRDVLVLYHWRLLQDSRVVMLSFSEKMLETDVTVTNEDGTVRADLLLGGYVLTPVSANETLVQYVVQIDMKATGMLNLMSNNQPLNVFNLKKKLQQTFQNSRSLYAGRKFTFEDLLDAAGNKTTGADESAGASAPSTASSAASGNQSHANSGASSSIAAPSPSSALPFSPAPSSTGGSNGKPGILQNVRSALSGSSKRGGKNRSAKLSTLPLCVLFLPSLLHYIVGNQYRGLVFMLSLIFSLRYVLMLHLGSPDRRPPTKGSGPLTQGRTLIRFPAELGKVLRFIQAKGEETGVDMTITHVAIKAAAAALREMPFLNGHLLFGKFYRSLEPGVDLSVVVDIPDMGSVLLKVNDAERKPVEYVSHELQGLTKAVADTRKSGVFSKREDLLRRLGPYMAAEVENWLHFLGSQLGLAVPALNVVPFPAGVCTVYTAPKGNDTDMDIALVPHSVDSSAPIHFTVGGIRVLPSLDAERRVAGSPVLNIAVAVDTRAASLTEAHRFASIFQHYLNNPTFIGLDKAEQRKLTAQAAAAKKAVGSGGGHH